MYNRLDERDRAPSWGYVWLDERQLALHAELKHAFEWAFVRAETPYGANLWLAADSCMGAEFYLSPESKRVQQALEHSYRIRPCAAPVRPLIYVAGFRHVAASRAQRLPNQAIPVPQPLPIGEVATLNAPRVPHGLRTNIEAEQNAATSEAR
jgi:hypothetical protein